MKLVARHFQSIRHAIGAIPGDVSNDAVGGSVARPEEIYAPATHAAALDPSTPIVVGSRGTGKSFWSSVLGQEVTREAAAIAYPRIGLEQLEVVFGFTGIVGGSGGVSADALDSLVPQSANASDARAFWWATILSGVQKAVEKRTERLSNLVPLAHDWERREEMLAHYEAQLQARGSSVLVIFDALDAVANTWLRRRLLTDALFEVVWAMRAYRRVKLKLFLRPDQINDDGLRFVELPKLRTGSVRLQWESTDLYGLLYARLALNAEQDARLSFNAVLAELGIRTATRDEILSRKWSLTSDAEAQSSVMGLLAGPFMAAGTYGYKKGKTYDWPVTHLADAFNEVTPRSFLGLMIGAATHGVAPDDRALTADGVRHGLRAASRTRVDQLHLEFPWIKGVLAPLAGLLLPLDERDVFRAWKQAKTVEQVRLDALKNKYLPPFPAESRGTEADLFDALRRIGVMFRRRDDRVDMPDLFRVAAKLLKKGGTAPA